MNSSSTSTRALRGAVMLGLGVVCVGVVAFGAFAVPLADAADNTLVSSSPAGGTTVDTSPQSLLLTFANALGAANNVQVVCNGSPFAIGTPQVGLDGVTLTVPVPNPLPKGDCVVSWLVS